jgi:hypothetical protein
MFKNSAFCLQIAFTGCLLFSQYLVIGICNGGVGFAFSELEIKLNEQYLHEIEVSKF